MREALVRGREQIPLLEDLLTAWPDVRINIDPKHDAAVEPLVDLIERTGTVDRVCIGAFSDRRLARMRERLGPRVVHLDGPPPGRPAPGGRPGPARRARSARPACRCRSSGARCPWSPSRFVAAAHERGLQVHVWTVNDADEMRRLLDLGVDGIMTDRADVLKAVLQERGAVGDLSVTVAADDRGACSADEARALYRALVLPRAIEEQMLTLLRRGQLSKWFSGIGQEAVSVGLVAALRPDDWILPVHRNLARVHRPRPRPRRAVPPDPRPGRAATRAGATARSTSARSTTTSSA